MDYNNHIDSLKKIESIIDQKLSPALSEAGIHTMQIAHRVKTVESVAGKIERKPEKYQSIMNITDLVGFRIICYFTDQIDPICAIIEDLFDIDVENCIDKSKILSPNAFGYLSVHYICSLKASDEYPKDLCKYRFEIQIRTVLQHTWAEIEHDLGYKNEFGVPKHVRREFSRMASLLEVADEGFGRIKAQLDVYSKEIIDKLQKGDVANISIDALTLKEYMRYNSEYLTLINDIASITGAVIKEANADQFIRQLSFLGIDDLGTLNSALITYRDLMIDQANRSLAGMEIDEYSSFIGLFYLCRAILIKGDYSRKEINAFFSLTMTKPSQIEHNTERIMKERENFPGV